MSSVGYYRVKLTDLSVGDHTVWFYKNGAKAGSVIVRIKEFCEDSKYLKYIDRYGRYRFFQFNNRWQLTDKSTSIGSVNKLVTSLLTDQSSSENIGYRKTRTLSLTASAVAKDELEILQDVYSSPVVYLYIGKNQSDDYKDWLRVTVTGDGIGRSRTLNFKTVNVEVTLPEQFTQTLV